MQSASSIDEQNTLSQQQQQEVVISVASLYKPPVLPKPAAPAAPPLPPPLPRRSRLGLLLASNLFPLLLASTKGDWEAAKAFFDLHPELLRYRLTAARETALHVAVSSETKGKHMEIFIQNLVNLMKEEDLALQNKDHETALYLAAVAGNVTLVKIMVEKSKALLAIPGGRDQRMPLYAAALFEKHEVVKYLYSNSNDLSEDDGWTPHNRGLLLAKCVELDMFDVALRIAEKYPEVGSMSVLGFLARKPEAFADTTPNAFRRTIMSSVICSKVGSEEPKNESEALQLLRLIWKAIVKKHPRDIDNILKGPADSNNQEKSESVNTMILKKLVCQHLYKMNAETQKIIKLQPDLATGMEDQPDPATEMEDQPEPATGMEDQALQLKNLISEHLLNMYIKSQKIIKQDNKAVVVSSKADQGPQKAIHELIEKIEDETEKIVDNRKLKKEDQAKSLQKLISEHVTSIHAAKLQRTTFSSRALFIAAEMGNTKFIVELISAKPDIIKRVNDSKQTILHIAVKHRHRDIYSLLYKTAVKNSIIDITDENDNNLLHVAGMRAPRLEDLKGVLLQLQQEILWFMEIEKIMPPASKEKKNKDGLTAYDLFTKEHNDLITQGEKWMKETASQCMLVSTLIATIVFASAFTVPGGYDQNTGIPLLYSKSIFIVFVVADAISLFSSSASILAFLSILTSPYAQGQGDSLVSLPRKLLLGLVTLFISVSTMMIAFSVNFYVLYDKDLKWMPILFSIFAAIPVLLYVPSQRAVFSELILWRNAYMRPHFKRKMKINIRNDSREERDSN